MLKYIKTPILLACVFMFFANFADCSEIIDKSGKKIKVTKPFTRIISLYGAHTENLFSLGLDNEIIGVSRNDSYPPRALKKNKFSYHDDCEKFIAAKPDLVLIRPMIARGYAPFVKKLEQAKIMVVSLQPVGIDDMFQYWRALGILAGREKQAQAMIEKFQTEVTRIKKIVSKIPAEKRKRVYFESIHKKMKTFSSHAIAMFVLETAGGINIAKDAIQVRKTNIAAYGKEKILSKAAIIDVYLAQKGRMNPVTVEEIKNEPGFQVIKAIKNNRVFLIDEMIVSRPTLRLLKGINTIAGILNY